MLSCRDLYLRAVADAAIGPLWLLIHENPLLCGLLKVSDVRGCPE